MLLTVAPTELVGLDEDIMGQVGTRSPAASCSSRWRRMPFSIQGDYVRPVVDSMSSMIVTRPGRSIAA